MSDGSVGRKCRTEVSDGSVGRKCRTEVSDGSVGRKCRTELSDGSVGRKSRTEVSDGSVGRKCRTEVSDGKSIYLATDKPNCIAVQSIYLCRTNLCRTKLTKFWLRDERFCPTKSFARRIILSKFS